MLALAESVSAREIVGTVQLPNQILQAHATRGFKVQLHLQLVGVFGINNKEQDKLSYLGFILYHLHDQTEKGALYIFCFAMPITRPLDETIVSTNCKRAISMNCSNGKLTTAVYGLRYCFSL